MNIVFCHGSMWPKYDWNKRTYDSFTWWADWLQFKVRQGVLVAPYIDMENIQPFGFYKDLKLDNIVAQTKLGFDIMISDDDFPYIKSSVDKISQDIPKAKIHKFSGRGHFTGSELPEIMSIIKF